MNTHIMGWTTQQEEELMKYCGVLPNESDFKDFAELTNRKHSTVRARYYAVRDAYFSQEAIQEAKDKKKAARGTVSRKRPKQLGAKSDRLWTASDERDLMQYVQEGKDWETIANALGRGEEACKQRVRLINREKELQKVAIESTVKETRVPLQQYIAQHPEQFKRPAEVLAPKEALTSVGEINTVHILTGQVIRIPIAAMNIESTPTGNNLVIQL